MVGLATLDWRIELDERRPEYLEAYDAGSIAVTKFLKEVIPVFDAKELTPSEGLEVMSSCAGALIYGLVRGRFSGLDAQMEALEWVLNDINETGKTMIRSADETA